MILKHGFVFLFVYWLGRLGLVDLPWCLGLIFSQSSLLLLPVHVFIIILYLMVWFTDPDFSPQEFFGVQNMYDSDKQKWNQRRKRKRASARE